MHMCFLTYISTKMTFFPKPQTTFLTCFKGDRRNYTKKESLPQPGIKLKPPGHESDMLTTEPPRQAYPFGELSAIFINVKIFVC